MVRPEILNALYLAILASVLPPALDACTIILVGKKASASGYPMVSHSTDGGTTTIDVRVTRTPRRTWPAGSTRKIYQWYGGYPRVVDAELSPAYAPIGDQVPFKPMLEIPQVAQTWAYWDTLYGLQNEWGLSMGEATSTARTVGFPHVGKTINYGFNYMGIADMSKIGLERCKTARCAIQVMGDLAVKYGFYSEDSGTIDKPGYGDSSESLGIVDAEPGEAWIFHVMTGANNKSAIWAAARIPDDHVSASPNVFVIRKMRLDDPDNFMYSSNIKDLAIEKGWWDAESNDANEFDFYGTYGSRATEEHQRSVDQFYSGRRIWRIFSLLSPAEGAKLDPAKGNLPVVEDPYPMSVPASGVTLDMVFTTHRDHYEGTAFDLTKGMAAGPFGNPNRGGATGNTSNKGNWDRALSMHRTAWSYVCVARPGGKSLMWYGQDAPHGTAYLPIYAADDLGPPSFTTAEGTMSKFSTKLAWWAFNVINQYQDLNFQLINKDVLARAHAIEKEGAALVPQWEAAGSDIADIAKLSNQFVEDKVAEWWRFRDELYTKFGRYKVTYNESEHGATMQKYPEWWMTSPDVGYTLWSPEGPNWDHKCVDASKPSESGISTTTIILVAAVFSLVVALICSIVAFQLGKRAGGRAQRQDQLGVSLSTVP